MSKHEEIIEGLHEHLKILTNENISLNEKATLLYIKNNEFILENNKLSDKLSVATDELNFLRSVHNKLMNQRNNLDKLNKILLDSNKKRLGKNVKESIVPKKRGRPRKIIKEESEEESYEEEVDDEEESDKEDANDESVEESVEESSPKKRGRPKKLSNIHSGCKKIGRPRKIKTEPDYNYNYWN